MTKGFFHGFLLALVICTQLSAQISVFKSYTFREGLNTYGINKCIQDKFGYIWVATQDGMYRFNGRSFEVLKSNITGPTGPAGNCFFDIGNDGNANIYAVDFNKGIDIINTRDLSVSVPGDSKTLFSQLPNLWLKKIYTDQNGNIWIGGRDFLACKMKDAAVFSLIQPPPDCTTPMDISFIKPISREFLLIGVGGYGILLFDTRTTKLLTIIRKLDAGSTQIFDEVKDMVMEKDTAYLLTERSIVKGLFKSGNWQLVQRYDYPEFAKLVVNCMVKENAGKFLVGTNSGLVETNIATASFKIYTAEPGKQRWLQDNMINDLMIDNHDNLWISTSKMLHMAHLPESGFQTFTGEQPGSDRMDHIYTLMPKNDNEIFATGTGGLYLTNLERRHTKMIHGSSALGLVHHIEQVEPGLWLVSSDKGMYAYEPQSGRLSQELLLQKFPEWKAYRSTYFNTAYRKGDVFYWASEEQEGLIKWDKKNGIIKAFKNGTPLSGGLPENHIHNLKTDKENNLWLLMDNYLARFNTQLDSVTFMLAYTMKAPTGLNSSSYFDLFDDGNTIWISTYGGGLNGYNKKNGNWKYITEKEGLSNNCVYGILPEKDSLFWVSTNMGLSRVNYITGSCINYYYEDGLQDNFFDEKSSLRINQKLYFGGINGFTEIDLDKFNKQEYNTPVYIDRIDYSVNNKKNICYNLEWDKLVLPSGTNLISIHLSALNYVNNHKVKFYYSIEGMQKYYIEVNDDNIITLNTLSYGSYTINIGYKNENGIFIDRALRLDIYLQPKWFQTWWFKLFVGLIISGFIYALYRYRISQIKKQHEIRKSIAADLHDDLGSTLNSVKVFTNLAIGGIKQEESLQQIKDNLNEATMGLRDMIWVLDDSLDTVDELVTRLKQYAIPITAASNMELKIVADFEAGKQKMTKEEKRNLFLVCKEVINNAIKYSGASLILVHIQPSGKKIRIDITDNGSGFDTGKVKKGYGLNNMQYRAKQIGYHVRMQSEPGKGTTITLLC